MQPSGVPLSMETLPPAPPAVRRRLPTQILLGIVLAGVGVVFAGISTTWNYLGPRNFPDGLATFVENGILLSLAEMLCLQVGLFLILWGIVRILPRVRLWSQLGPLLILVGALLGAAVGLVEYAQTSAALSGGATSSPEWLGDLLLGSSLTAYVATTLGLVVSLAAVAWAIVLRPSPQAVPLPP